MSADFESPKNNPSPSRNRYFIPKALKRQPFAAILTGITGIAIVVVLAAILVKVLLGIGIVLILVAALIHPRRDKRFRSGYRDVTTGGYVWNSNGPLARRTAMVGVALLIVAAIGAAARMIVS